MDELITKYLNKTASEDEKKQLLEWLKTDSQNREYFLKTERLWHLSTIMLMPENDIRAAMVQVNSKISDKEYSRNRHISLFIKTSAAIIIFCILSSVSFYIGMDYRQGIAPELITMNQVIMGKANRGSFILPDGTEVWLNSESKLIYPDIFNSESRNVKLEGEGFFKVKKDKTKPFYVETENMVVNVLGTEFDLQNYSQKTIAETVLLSGRVEIKLKYTDTKFILAPNEKITYNKETHEHQVKHVDAKEYAIWANDKLVLDSEELSSVLKKMERWYGITITADPSLPFNHRLSLTIRYEPKEEILKMLSLILPITYTIEGDHIKIGNIVTNK